ncbi:MAG: hypothetical protein ABI217_10180, partial [Chthoniobacterales bacterium]
MSCLALGLAGVFSLFRAEAGESAPCRLIQTIALPNVKGRIDHLAADVEGRRLFVCALGNNSVEVVDLKLAKQVQSIQGLGAPQGVAYIPQLGRLVAANDEGGRVNFYEGRDLRPAGVVDLKDDADNVRYDAQSKRVYVGYGSGAVAILDPSSAQLVGSIGLTAHPESFQLERGGSRIFANVPEAGEVVVLDRRQRKTLARWSTGGAAANFPMALDEKNARLFIGCRRPARLIVLDTAAGKVVASLGISGDVDDIFYDAERKRIYAICGAGMIDVIKQRDADHYQIDGAIRTAAG